MQLLSHEEAVKDYAAKNGCFLCASNLEYD